MPVMPDMAGRLVSALTAVADPNVDAWPSDDPSMRQAVALGYVERVKDNWELTQNGEQIVAMAVAGTKA